MRTYHYQGTSECFDLVSISAPQHVAAQVQLSVCYPAGIRSQESVNTPMRTGYREKFR